MVGIDDEVDDHLGDLVGIGNEIGQVVVKVRRHRRAFALSAVAGDVDGRAG